MIWIAKSTYFYDLVPIVKNIKLNMFEEIILGTLLTKSSTLLFNFPNEPPQWKIVIIHLEVKVINDSTPELCNFSNFKLLLAQGLPGFVLPKF